MALFKARIGWKRPSDAHQGVGHADHTSGNGAEFA